MSTGWKRAGGVLTLIIAALVLLISVGGVVGVWVVKGQAEDLTTAVFSPIDNALDTAATTLGKANTRIDTARTRVSNAQEFAGQLGQNAVGNGPVLSAISETISTKLQPQIEAAQETIGNALDLVAGVNNTIVRLNKLPGVNLPTLTDELSAAQTRISSLQDRIQSFMSDLQAAIQGRLQLTGTRISGVLSDVDSGLQSIQTAVNTKNENVKQTQARFTDLKDSILTWITVGAIVGTIFLLWIAFSQVVMLRWGWSLVTSKPKDIALPTAPTPTGDLTPTAL